MVNSSKIIKRIIITLT